MSRLILAAVLTMTLAISLAPPARAAMLEADACVRLKAEQSLLDGRGVRANLVAGPAAAGRLSPQQLDDVRRLIEVDEQVTFRCPIPPPPKAAARQPGEKGGPEGGGAAKSAPKPKAAESAGVPKAAESASVPKAAASAAKPNTAEATQAAKPAPKPKSTDGGEAGKSMPKAAPKAAPKVDDAYRP